jgi:uncharacterized protein (DUF3084 family)
MTTPIEKILPREVLAHIRPRSAETRIADAERERDQAKAELHVERVEHKQTRKERDMVTRQLQKTSRKKNEALMRLAKAITVCGRHKEHDDCRHLAAELAAALETLR